MAKEYKISAARLEELRAELRYLKTVREKEVAEQIKEARSFGDLSENSEYDEAKNEQGRLFSRIAEIEDIIANHVIIEQPSGDDDAVYLGSTVTVLEVAANEEEQYQIVGSQEAAPHRGKISEESPFGRALLGAKLGATVTVDAPAGAIVYQVLKIEH